jgi:hypothetical protein
MRMTWMSVEDDFPEDGSMRMTWMSVEDDYPRIKTRG